MLASSCAQLVVQQAIKHVPQTLVQYKSETWHGASPHICITDVWGIMGITDVLLLIVLHCLLTLTTPSALLFTLSQDLSGCGMPQGPLHEAYITQQCTMCQFGVVATMQV